MTAGNNGAGTPENDDPFAYLYRSEGGDGGANGAAGDGGAAQYGRPAQPGVPRTSYNQVHRVGERQYGGQQAAQRPGYGPGAAPADQPAAAYAQSPSTSYAAPETLPGGAPPRRAAPAGHGSRGRGGGGRGPNNQGLLIGAIAVVAVVVIGIVIAMLTNGDGDGEDKQEAGSSQSAPADGGEQEKPADEGKDQGENKDKSKPFSSAKFDAVGMKTAGGATVANEVQGARSKGGAYIAGMNQPGATATWRIDVPKAGEYTFFIGYGVPGKDTKATLLVNGKDREQELKNWANAKEGEWDKGWTTTYSYVNLTKGTNTIDLTCGEGQGCEFNLDWVQLKEGQVKD
ncbi:carbohydrate-binding protein [Streptomyces albus]|uniref:carbohydrate-binding protein n=1 Tax=Streptomyces albus TaxID=1888 RepID=UPI0004C61C9F|nr:carbohydrate-binding protein [Streptomyces albus]